MKLNKSQNNAIDAVITWVDGNDPEHRKKREFLMKQDSNILPSSIVAGKDRTRFKDNGEILFCITSIRKYAPWIRQIHIVTDNQVPAFLTPELRSLYNVKIVDHSEILKSYEWALPTFNSRTIETALYRIPGLAPRYIYFNDDIILTRSVLPTDFFEGQRVVLRGRWRKLRMYGSLRIYLRQKLNLFLKKFFGINHTMHLLQQMRSARLAGMKDMYYRVSHIPHPQRKYTSTRFFDENPGCFVNNIKFPFRDINQFSGIFLASNLEIINGNARLMDDSNALMINGETDNAMIVVNKLKKLAQDNIYFICLQSIEKLPENSQELVMNVMKKRLDLDSNQNSQLEDSRTG